MKAHINYAIRYRKLLEKHREVKRCLAKEVKAHNESLETISYLTMRITIAKEKAGLLCGQPTRGDCPIFGYEEAMSVDHRKLTKKDYEEIIRSL